MAPPCSGCTTGWPAIRTASRVSSSRAPRDLLRRRQPRPWCRRPKDDAAAGVRHGRVAVKAGLRKLGLYPSRSSQRSTAPRLGGGYEITLACNHRIAVDDDSVVRSACLSRRSACSPAGRRDARRTPARPAVRADGRAAARHPVQTQRGQEKGLSTSWSRPARSSCPPPRRGSSANPDATQNPWDKPGYKMPGGSPSSPALAGFPAGVPRPLRKRIKGRGLPGAAGDPVGRRRRCARSISTPPRGIESRYLTNLIVNQGLEEHDPGVLLRPAGDQRRQARPQGIEPFKAIRSASSAPA